MKAKYLGRFDVVHTFDPETIDEPMIQLQHEDGEDDEYYDFETFLRIPDSPNGFHGIQGESNTSAVACKVQDDGEQVKLWRIW